MVTGPFCTKKIKNRKIFLKTFNFLPITNDIIENDENNNCMLLKMEEIRREYIAVRLKEGIHMMSNAALKAILAEYGKKAKAIHCTNFSVQINQSFVGVKPITNDDIKFVTYGGTDFFCVPQYDSHNKTFPDFQIGLSVQSFGIVQKLHEESGLLHSVF